MALFIINEKENYHYDLTVIFPEIDNSHLNQELSIAIEDHKMAYHGTTVAYHFEQLKKKQQPIIFNYEKDFKKYPNRFSEINLADGCKETYGSLLQTGDEAFGVMYFNSKQTGSLKSVDASFYQQVADLTAIALSNILTKESLLIEKQFKETLLAISESIASIQNRKELFTTIFQKIPSIIPKDNTAIVILNEDGTEWKDLSNPDRYHDGKTSNEFAKLGFDGFNKMDDVVKKSLTETGIVTLDELLEGKQFFAPFMSEAGLKEFMYTPMICQGKIIGSLFFDSEKYGTYSPKYFELFKAVAAMIAVAVSNILANEEILEREKKKTQLLEIIELIAQVKDAADLLRLIVEKIKPIFNFHDCGLFVLSPDGKTYTDLAAVIPAVSPSELNEKIAAVSENISHKNSALEWMMDNIATSGRPVLFDSADLQQKFPEYPQLNAINILETGYRDCLAFNLKARGQIIGMFCINALQKDFFTTSIFAFFQSVTESIAIAVANVLATKEILEREKEKTVQLEILETLNNKNSWDEKFAVVAEKFDAFIGCDLFSYSIRMNEG
ncbi:MAG: GAF domain-containing protein, partial [Rhizobacter sp.]|nr:GAF domain-containing protein [Ferruginibacter sp.]